MKAASAGAAAITLRPMCLLLISKAMFPSSHQHISVARELISPKGSSTWEGLLTTGHPHAPSWGLCMTVLSPDSLPRVASWDRGPAGAQMTLKSMLWARAGEEASTQPPRVCTEHSDLPEGS